MYQIISKVDEAARTKYMDEASNSLHRTVYCQLNHNLQQSNYFRDELSVREISMMVRLRAEILNLNYIPHRADLPVICNICNRMEREDVVHFLGKCPTLRETRRCIFGKDFLAIEEVIFELNQMNVSKLYQFCTIALRYRNRILQGLF